MDRREFLVGAGSLGIAAAAPSRVWAASSRIRDENAKPGTREWMLANPRMDPANKIRCPRIEGYCSRTSVKAGESLAIKVSTSPPSKYTLDIYRMGYYGGDG